ncbi:MAG: GDYXXLXY domain-containing protein [Agarilytica sp.]
MITKPYLRKLLVLVIVAQLAVLAFMAIKREVILAYGDTVYLRSAPIDPRDPFRGDFVRLEYGINRIFKTQYQGAVPFSDLKRGASVFAVLEPMHDDVYVPMHYTDTKPESGLFIKGRVTSRHRYRWADRKYIDAKFGIEQYFVQQGKGKDMEKRLGSRDGLQIPAEMKIALGSDGTGVIQDYRWSTLGIQLSFKRTTSRGADGGGDVMSPIVEVRFQNVSAAPISFVSYDNECSFSLRAANRYEFSEPLDAGCSHEQKQSIKRVLLAPDASHVVSIDFAQPRWHLLNEHGERVEMASLDLSSRYRLRYTAPQADTAWQGFIDTPAFRPSGNID